MNDPLEIAQLIVSGSYINISNKEPFISTSAIYRFTNEDILSYFHHLQNKQHVLTVIGSGCQILNGILAKTKYFDCFDISIFLEYYLYLQLATIQTLTKEEYIKYYFSTDREEIFNDDLYEKIRQKLKGKYKEFWDGLYMFYDGIDIYNSLLFRSDVCIKDNIIENNPYLQENNYQNLRHMLETDTIKITPKVVDIKKHKFNKQYDLINLSNILTYHFNGNDINKLIKFLEENFKLTENGEIINYIFNIKKEVEDKIKEQIKPNCYIENIKDKKLLIYKK